MRRFYALMHCQHPLVPSAMAALSLKIGAAETQKAQIMPPGWRVRHDSRIIIGYQCF
jgi:hypothetical protein